MEKDFLLNSLTVISILLVIFWKVSDPRPRKEKIQDFSNPAVITRSLFSFFYFVLNYLSGKYFPLPLNSTDNFLSWVGVGIFLAGVGLCVWAKITMGKLWGIPAEHHKNRQSILITTGPFRYTRNPIYLGIFMVLIGYGIAAQSYFTFLALIPIYIFWQSTLEEEKLLEHHFKEEYKKYKKEVPRFF